MSDKDLLMSKAEVETMYNEMLEAPGAELALRIAKTEDALQRERAKGKHLTISEEAWQNFEYGIRCWVGSRMTRFIKHEEIRELELDVTIKINGVAEEGEIHRLKLTIPDGENRL